MGDSLISSIPQDMLLYAGGGLVALLVLILVISIICRGRKKKTAADSTVPVISTPETPVEEIPADEAPVEAVPVAEEPARPEEVTASALAHALVSLEKSEGADAMSTMLATADRHVLIKYRKSFRARMIQSDEETKTYYSDIKNYLLSFEGVASADSWNYESFANGRKQIAKINVSGKTVVLFLALAPATLEGSKYKYEDVGARKRFEKTPLKIKIRSSRSFKWAKELIDMTMAENGRAFLSLSEENFVDPLIDKEALIARNLIEIMAKDVDTGAKVTGEELLSLIESGAHIEMSAGADAASDADEE